MSKSTKTTQENKPPEWAKPLFVQSATEAKKLYDSGSGFNVYGGQTIADQSGATTDGLNRLEQAARGPMQGLANNAVSTLGGYDTALKNLNPTASGNMLLSPVYKAAGGQSAADKYLTEAASGKYLRDGNPYFEAGLDRQASKSAALVNSSIAGSGRYGSGAHSGVLADSIGEMRRSAYENQWNAERDRQMQAVGAIDTARNNRLGIQASEYGRERGNQLNAITNQAAITGNKLAGIGQAMGMQAMPGNMLSQVGAQRDAREQALLNDQQNRFYQNDMQDWTRLGALQAAAQGAAGSYGTMVNTTRQPMNPLGILGGIGSLAMPFMAPMMGLGGLGMAGGAALGAGGVTMSPYLTPYRGF